MSMNIIIMMSSGYFIAQKCFQTSLTFKPKQFNNVIYILYVISRLLL